ncbi:MAG: SPOR domain-containing protein [Candidatus Nanoarchaeia archaeon]
MKIFFKFLFVFFFLFSCSTTKPVVQNQQLPPPESVKVKITKIGEDLTQKQTPSFVLFPNFFDLNIPENKDSEFSVDVVNCKQDLLAITVKSDFSIDWVYFQPVFLLKPFEVKKFKFVMKPYNRKSRATLEEFGIKFSTNEFFQDLKLKVSVLISEVSQDKKEVSQAKHDVVFSPVNTPERLKKTSENIIRRPVYFYTVHVGSFKTKEEALEHVRRIPRLEPQISVVGYDLGSKGIWYRVLIGLYKSVSEAAGVAKHFKEFMGFDYASPIRVEEEHFMKNIVNVK